MRISFGQGTLWLGQAGFGTVERFLENKLSSHAAAAAYYFLLSIAPLILGIVSLLNTSLINYPELTAKLFLMLERFNPQLNEAFFRGIGILRSSSAVSSISLLGFLWTSRQIIAAMQTAFAVIFPGAGRRNFFWSTFLSLVLVPGVLALLLLSALFNAVLRVLHTRVEAFAWLEQLYDLLLSVSGVAFPFVLVFGLIFVCYRFLPVDKPSSFCAALGALLCTLAVFGLKATFFRVVSLAKYHVVYGSLGAVIGILLWVYFIFLIFFFFAQFVHMAGRLDVYILNKLVAPVPHKGLGRKVHALLFPLGGIVFARYGRRLRRGEELREDFTGQVCHVCRGLVMGFVAAAGQDGAFVGDAGPGQTLGEMAYLPGERTVIRAREDAVVLLVPRDMFEGMLEQNPALSRRLIASLSQRVGEMAERLGRGAPE